MFKPWSRLIEKEMRSKKWWSRRNLRHPHLNHSFQIRNATSRQARVLTSTPIWLRTFQEVDSPCTWTSPSPSPTSRPNPSHPSRFAGAGSAGFSEISNLRSSESFARTASEDAPARRRPKPWGVNKTRVLALPSPMQRKIRGECTVSRRACVRACVPWFGRVARAGRRGRRTSAAAAAAAGAIGVSIRGGERGWRGFWEEQLTRTVAAFTGSHLPSLPVRMRRQSAGVFGLGQRGSGGGGGGASRRARPRGGEQLLGFLFFPLSSQLRMDGARCVETGKNSGLFFSLVLRPGRLNRVASPFSSCWNVPTSSVSSFNP